jgi:hypothetical protein
MELFNITLQEFSLLMCTYLVSVVVSTWRVICPYGDAFVGI